MRDIVAEFTVTLKQADGNYAEVNGSLVEEGNYITSGDETGEYISVTNDPVFDTDFVGSEGDEKRLLIMLETYYWDYQDDYVIGKE